MKSFDRKSYNSAYYAQNRDKILLKRNAQRPNQPRFKQKSDDRQLSLFDGSNRGLNRSNWFQRFKLERALKFALIFLVILDSCYLLSEAVEFYCANDLSPGKSVLAAMIVEFMIVALSTIRQSNVALKVLSKSVLALLFLYSSWSFCSSAVGKGCGVLDQIEMLDAKIERIKAELKQRDVLIQENLRRQRITLAGNMAAEKNDHVVELSRLENERMKRLAVSPKAQTINLFSAVGLRLLIQLSNFIILHHLAAGFRRSHRKTVPNRTRLAPVIRLVH